ncbi:MAG: diaminopimelate epimerase [Chloroflexota bacterium]
MLSFTKGHGLGNDYIVVQECDLPAALGVVQIQRICDRQVGIGSDGVLLLVDPWSGADFGLRIFNPDGTEAEKSGNGLRIFAKFLWDHQLAKRDTFSVDTKGGRVECHCHIAGDRTESVTVEMGRCRFSSGALPMTGPEREVVNETLRVGADTLTITAVSMGNPHCVVFTEALDEETVRRLGPQIEHHEAFPERINVQFARIVSRQAVAIMIWERGAGWTLASGSSSCAVASAAVRNGLCQHGPVTVSMPGGDLDVEVRPDWSIRLHGPVEEICTGAFSSELIEALWGAR